MQVVGKPSSCLPGQHLWKGLILVNGWATEKTTPSSARSSASHVVKALTNSSEYLSAPR